MSINLSYQRNIHYRTPRMGMKNIEGFAITPMCEEMEWFRCLYVEM